MSHKKQELHFIESFGLSGAAAIISKTAAAPIERVKLLVQNQDEMLKSGRLETPYKGVVDCTMRTYKAEGIASFWRGKFCLWPKDRPNMLKTLVRYLYILIVLCVFGRRTISFMMEISWAFFSGRVSSCLNIFSPGHFWALVYDFKLTDFLSLSGNLANCIRYFPTQALNFAFKDQVKALFKPKKSDSYALKFSKNIASGGAAGAMSLTFVYSLDYARTRLANDAKSAGKGGGDRQFNGLVDVYSKTIKSDGIVGLYRGFVISCVGIVVYRGFYFGLYDTLKPLLLGDDAGLAASFVLGYAVTVSSGLASYPIDTIRRRMMMTSGEAVKYKGSIDCAVQIMKNEGFMSLMKGAGANILRGMAGAGVLAGFDKFKSWYIYWRSSDEWPISRTRKLSISEDWMAFWKATEYLAFYISSTGILRKAWRVTTFSWPG